MAEYTIFSRSIARADPNTDVFVRLSNDGSNEVFRSIPKKMDIITGIGYITPIVVCTFTDGSGDLFNHMKANTSATFELEFGRVVENASTMGLMISRVEQQNTALGRPHDMDVKITFVARNWYQLLSKRFSQGWSGKTHSEIAKEIAATCQFDDMMITNTNEPIESVIQPYWTNLRMFRWLRQKALPSDDAYGHFEFGTTIDNTFHFESTGGVINRQRDQIISGNLPVMRLQAPPQSNRESIRSKDENNNIPAYFMGFSNKEFFMTGTINSAGGVKSMYFDWDKDEYVTTGHKFADEPTEQLSDTSLLRDGMDDNAELFYGGRDTHTKQHAKNVLNESAYSLQQFDILTEGSPFIKIFDIVEMVIPNTSLGSRVPLSTIYSGFYMIAMVKHHFQFDDRGVDYSTEVTLSRHGVDRINYDGFDDLVKSTKGKVK